MTSEESMKFIYQDKSYDEQEFDRKFGPYNEHYPNHEYRIVINNESTITEYIFNSRSKLEKDTYMLDELKSIMKNTYQINVYDRKNPHFRKYTSYYEGRLTGKGSQILENYEPCHPEDDGWIKHGICYDYYPDRINVHTYRNGKTYGWNIEKCLSKNEIVERLYEGSECLGYRIKQNSIITKNTISVENLAKYSELPTLLELE